jgi:hypothetical protein
MDVRREITDVRWVGLHLLKANSLFLLSKVDLLVFISIYQHMLSFFYKTATLMRMSTILSLPLQLVNPGNCHSD